MVFLALIVLMLIENALLVVAGRGAEVEAQLHTRTYDEEAAEALEAVGAKTEDRGAMIAVVFLLVLIGLTVGLSLFGGGGSGLPVAELFLLLVALFIAFFGAGIYVGAALGVLGLIAGFAFSDRPFWAFLGQTVWNPSSSFVLVAVPLFLLMGEILLRAGLSDRLYKALNVWLDRLPGGLLHTNIAASGVFSAISGSSRRDGSDHGLGGAALLQGHALRPEDGARLARGRRRARQSRPAGHHLHRLRSDDRDLGRRPLHRRRRPEHPGDGAVRAR